MVVEPGARIVWIGVTEIVCRTAVLTVNGAVPFCPPNAAVMVTLPGLTLNAIPTVLTVAIAVLLELHVASPEMSCVLWSLKVAVAKNCC